MPSPRAAQLHADDAPATTDLVRQLAVEKGASCSGGGCRIYRSEALPKPGAVDNYGGPGPPYALIQGSFQSTVFTSVSKEKAPLAKRGDACLIGTGARLSLTAGAAAADSRLLLCRARFFYCGGAPPGVGERAHRVGACGGQHGGGGCNRGAAGEGGGVGPDARHGAAGAAALLNLAGGIMIALECARWKNQTSPRPTSELSQCPPGYTERSATTALCPLSVAYARALLRAELQRLASAPANNNSLTQATSPL